MRYFLLTVYHATKDFYKKHKQKAIIAISSLVGLMLIGLLVLLPKNMRRRPSVPAESTAPTPSTSVAPSALSPAPESEQPSLSPVPSPTPTQPNWAEIDVTKFEIFNNEKHGWGHGKWKDEKNRPTDAIAAQEKYGALGGLFIGEAENVIYLTFDEGYENGYTEKILDVLKEKNQRATFFVTYDYVSKNDALVRRMIAEGHVLGNHSMHHPSMPEIPLATAKTEITDLHDYVFQQYGVSMRLFRPPMGHFSERTLALAQALGYESAFWSFAYHDWDPKNQNGYEKALQKTVDDLHPGAIYLLHAVSKDNADILGEWIDITRGKGYAILPLE
ncbi:MAG: polysaccharide deacetylase family protein [Christensenellaceae bacterium]|jgi:peptidoglycan-N-acetylmuramic acid deacetylase